MAGARSRASGQRLPALGSAKLQLSTIRVRIFSNSDATIPALPMAFRRNRFRLVEFALHTSSSFRMTAEQPGDLGVRQSEPAGPAPGQPRRGGLLARHEPLDRHALLLLLLVPGGGFKLLRPELLTRIAEY